MQTVSILPSFFRFTNYLPSSTLAPPHTHDVNHLLDNRAISMNSHQRRNYICSRYFLSFVLLPIHLLAHSNFLASDLRNHHATRLGRSHSRNTSHCGYTLTVLGVLGLSIPAQEYDLERAICTQGHPRTRASQVSFFSLFFILIAIRTLHPPSASVSYFFLSFFFFCFLFILFRVCRRAACNASAHCIHHQPQ